MREKKMTRRDLLQGSAAAGVLASVPLAAVLGGCRSKIEIAAKGYNWQDIDVVAPEGSICPRVTSLRDSGFVLSWLEPEEGGISTFRMATWRGGIWSAPVTIADGQTFSRDRAAAPGVIALSARTLIAYWSQKRRYDESRNEIELYTAVSNNGGARWTTAALVNRALAQPGEDNGYASLAAIDEIQAALVWLDGRDWEKEKRVKLRSRTVRQDGSMGDVVLLDEDTCTCCSTAVVRTPSGLMAAYRGHTADNIRDIAMVRWTNNGWSQPRVAHPDHWHIEACPVNGPDLDADGARVALVWFSGAQDQPAVKLAFSHDGGGEFSPPVRIDAGKPIGRAQVTLLPDGSAVALWLENESGTARLLARRVRPDGTAEPPFEIGRGANLGFPHTASTANGIAVTWPEAAAVSQVHAGLLKLA